MDPRVKPAGDRGFVSRATPHPALAALGPPSPRCRGARECTECAALLRALSRGTRPARGGGFLTEERRDGVEGRVGKLLVHGKLALGKPSSANAADRGERLHF